VRYEILGPLRVLNNEKSSTLSARHVEVVLAVLLVNADRLVTADQLIAELWHDKPPRTAMASLYVYISKLRKFLHGIGYTTDPIVTKAPGYALRAEDDELDARNFELLFQRGRQDAEAARHEQASESFAAALGLWRGPALGNLREGPMLGGFVTWLEETRLECLELMIESNMALGLHREMIGQLYSLTVEHPLRETFHSQLMLALYRAERRADALAAYRSARKTLHDQIGMEPGRALSALHRAILSADNRLDLRESRTAVGQRQAVNGPGRTGEAMPRGG
jgi:SARP family transcriptional regulator, regulator of embCAB operon